MASAQANLRGKISLDDSEWRRGWRNATNTASRAGKTIEAKTRNLRAGFSSAAKGVADLVVRVGSLVAKLALITIPTAFIAGLYKAAKAGSAFEDVRLKIETFTGSAAAAADILKEITEFAVVTPFETKDLEEVTALLLGAGIEAGNVVDIVKEIAAVSKDGQQLGELGDALAKGFAKGKFQTEQLNKFLERGINLMPQFERVTGLTGDALSKAIEDGLRFDQVREAIAGMSAEGGQFFGLLEKQSQTASGLVSTLKSNFEELWRQIGIPINDAIKPLLDEAITMAQGMTEEAKAMGTAMANFLTGVVEKFKAGTLWESIEITLATAFLNAADKLAFAMEDIALSFAETVLDGLNNVIAEGRAASEGLKAGMAAALIPGGKTFEEAYSERANQVREEQASGVRREEIGAGLRMRLGQGRRDLAEEQASGGSYFDAARTDLATRKGIMAANEAMQAREKAKRSAAALAQVTAAEVGLGTSVAGMDFSRGMEGYYSAQRTDASRSTSNADRRAVEASPAMSRVEALLAEQNSMFREVMAQ